MLEKTRGDSAVDDAVDEALADRIQIGQTVALAEPDPAAPGGERLLGVVKPFLDA